MNNFFDILVKDFYQTNNTKDRVYIIDYPYGYYHTCFKIIQTSEEFHMFGSTDKTPSYEGAKSIHIEPDDNKRRKIIIEFLLNLLNSISAKKRVSVYSIDANLKKLIALHVNNIARCRVSFFGVFDIVNKEHDSIQEGKYYVLCPLCNSSISNNKLDWHIQYKCHKRILTN
jgi:hypothetical protein